MKTIYGKIKQSLLNSYSGYRPQKHFRLHGQQIRGLNIWP